MDGWSLTPTPPTTRKIPPSITNQSVTTTKTKLADLDSQYQLVDKAKSAVSAQYSYMSIYCMYAWRALPCPDLPHTPTHAHQIQIPLQVGLAVDLSGAAVEKAVELNEKYSLVDKATEAAKKAAKQVKESIDKA